LRAPRGLQVSLPEEVRLVSVTGGADTRIEEHKVTFQLDASANPRRISLLYDSPLKQSLLTGGARFPLPNWNGRTTTVGWEIILPDRYRLRSTTGGSTAHPERELGWSHRFFGPLGSSTFKAGGSTLFAITALSENSLDLMPGSEASSAIRKR